MKDIFKRIRLWKVRPAAWPGLAFFVCLTLSGCRPNDGEKRITVEWRGDKAFSVLVSGSLLQGIPVDSIDRLMHVKLLTGGPDAIFGHYAYESGGVRFTPLIPFTAGLHYGVWLRGKQVGSFDIPAPDPAQSPVVTAIYPTGDTLPENLLKIHIYFSKPMREGQSGKYVNLLKNGGDTVSGAFLDLQPELWNPDRTMLTLWLDPGRIKRDLQPNRRMGAPMLAGAHYKIAVAAAWQSAAGIPMTSPYERAFVTGVRDNLPPVPAQWQLTAPTPDTRGPVEINLKKALDYSLLRETLTVLDVDNKPVNGQWQIGKGEMQCRFEPAEAWKSGKYALQVETRLEDLAGNNINRPFDRDVTKSKGDVTDRRFVTIPFTIGAH